MSRIIFATGNQNKMREIREIMQGISEGREPVAAMGDCFEYLEENPKLARHLFASAKKEDIYRYVCSAVEIVLNHSIDVLAGEQAISPEDKKVIVNTCKYVVQGNNFSTFVALCMVFVHRACFVAFIFR